MDISEEDLQAYVDGELAPAGVARVEAAIAADPGVARRVAQARAVRARLDAAFDPVLREPVPDRLLARLRDSVEREAVPPSARVVDLAARRIRPAWHGLASHGPAYALAASLLVVAASLWLRPGASPVRMQGDRLVAGGVLARDLDRALASAPDAASPIAIGISFRARDGRVCRTFAQARAVSGLACREGGRWVVDVLATSGPVAVGEVRQAASAMPPEVQAAVDARLQGEPFDAVQERAARDHGWR